MATPHEPRAAFTARSKSTLIHEWTVGTGDKAESYRLLAVGKHSAGYEDSYMIEILGRDGLGEPRWDKLHTWERDNDASTLLVDAIKGLLAGAGRAGL